MPATTNTLTLIGNLDLASGVTGASQLFINTSPANNIIQRISLTGIVEYLFVEADLISNTGGTQSGYNLSENFTFTPAEQGVGTFDFATVPSGQVLGNAETVGAAPTATPISSLLDVAFSSVEGALLFRGADGWAALGPGEVGFVLSSGGDAGPPVWEAGAAGPNIPTSAQLLGSTGESTFQAITLGANLALDGSTLVAAGSNWALSDGTHVVEDVSTLLVPGALVRGENGSATLSLEGAPWSISQGTTTITAVSELTLSGSGVSLSGTNGIAQVSITGGGGGAPAVLSVGDGTDSLASVTSILFEGATVSGSGGNAVVVLPAGGTGGEAWSITDGTSTVSNVSKLTVMGGTISATGTVTGQATLTIAAQAGSGGTGGGLVNAPTVVQSAANVGSNVSPVVVLGSTPTVGNMLIALGEHWTNGAAVQGGYIVLENTNGVSRDGVLAAYKLISTTTEPTNQTPFSTGAGGASMVVFEVSGAGNLPTLAGTFQEVMSASQTLTGVSLPNALILGQITEHASTDPMTISATVNVSASGPASNNGPRLISGFSKLIEASNIQVTSIEATFTGAYDGNGVLISIPPSSELNTGGGGGGSFVPGPVIGMVPFVRPDASTFTLSNQGNATPAGTNLLTETAGGPLTFSCGLNGSDQSIAYHAQDISEITSANTTITVLGEVTPFFQPQGGAPGSFPLVIVTDTYIFAFGLIQNGSNNLLSISTYSASSLNGPVSRASVNMNTKVGWFRAILNRTGLNIQFQFSTNGITWLDLALITGGYYQFTKFLAAGVGNDGYTYYGNWSNGNNPIILTDVWNWQVQ